MFFLSHRGNAIIKIANCKDGITIFVRIDITNRKGAIPADGHKIGTFLTGTDSATSLFTGI